MYSRKGLHLSVLRALAYNRHACGDAPLLELEEKKGLQALFSVDGVLAALPRKAATFLQTNRTIVSPPHQTARYTSPKVNDPCV